MDLEALKRLLKSGETNRIEFKKSIADLEDICRSLCGFLNNEGGRVLIGVTNKDKKLVGQEIGEKTAEKIARVLAKFEPAPNILEDYVSIGDGARAVIILTAKPDKQSVPYVFRGVPYERYGSSKEVMPQARYQQLLSTRTVGLNSWGSVAVDTATIDDLDHELILDTVKEGVANGRIPEGYSTDNVEKALKHFDLLHGSQLNRAAIVLFGKKPSQWFPQCLLKLARFRGTSHLNDFIDSKHIMGNAFLLIEEAMNFANRHLPVASYFPDGQIEREDVPLFPLNALREVFANAICHRSYELAGGSVSFAIFDDRLEVWSYGLFPEGVENNTIKTLHKSIPRNPKIANILYYRKVIEKWGRGIQLIVDECKRAGHPEPMFVEESGGVKVVLPSKIPLGPSTMIQEEKDFSELTLRQQEIVNYLKVHNEVSLSDFLTNLPGAIEERTLQDELQRLKSLGVLKLKGFGRGSRWILAKEVREDTERHGKTRKDTE